MEAVQKTVPPPASFGPRSEISRRILALEVGRSTTFAYLDRSDVTGRTNYWGRQLGRIFASRRDRKDRSRLRLYRIA